MYSLRKRYEEEASHQNQYYGHSNLWIIELGVIQVGPLVNKNESCLRGRYVRDGHDQQVYDISPHGEYEQEEVLMIPSSFKRNFFFFNVRVGVSFLLMAFPSYLAPTQLLIQGQWWSKTETQLWQISQCLERGGFRIFWYLKEIEDHDGSLFSVKILRRFTSHSGQRLAQSFFSRRSFIFSSNLFLITRKHEF